MRPASSADRVTLPWWGGGVVAIVVGLFVGALTAYAQGWLSDGLGSLANSAGPWSLAAFLVAMLTRRPAVAAVWACVVLASCAVVVLAGARIVRRDLRPRLAIPLCVGSAGLVAAVVALTARLV